jgi:hypothetical protein
MAGSKKQMRIAAVLIAVAVMMIAGQAMAGQVTRGSVRPGGGVQKGLPEWFRIQITRGVAQNGRSPLIEFRSRGASADAKVGWGLARLGR